MAVSYPPLAIREMVKFAQDREVAGRYETGSYCKRPNVIQYESDLQAMLAEGMDSFHASVERWSRPMMLEPGMNSSELDKLRIGWDFIVDIDTKFFEYSRLCADLVYKALKAHGISSLSVKFSGNNGFHIGVPFEAFPSSIDGKPTASLFPEAPRTIALYLKEFIREKLADDILRYEGSIDAYAEKTGKRPEELLVDGQLDPYAALELDTIVITPRHLVRMPYSFHEKSGLFSIPIKPKEITGFTKEKGKRVRRILPFLSRRAEKDEASDLVSEAFAFAKRKPEESSHVKTERMENALPEEFFPPCIKNILKAELKDGRKRAEFILRCFLSRCGWGWGSIEEIVLDWNSRLPEPLPENYLKSHISWHKKQKRVTMPPNCDNASFYKDLLICEPIPLCRSAKNPVVAALRALRKRKRSRAKTKKAAKGSRS